jgi:hypothetical protein
MKGLYMCELPQKLKSNSLAFWVLMAAVSLPFTTQDALAADVAPSAANETPVSVSATAPEFPNRITTLDGKVYEKVTLEKVDPDGLLVTYVPTGGGSGTAKLKFRNLPAELQARFGYDPARASDYETARARGEAMWRVDNALWTEQRRAAQAEEATWERQHRAEAEARLAREAEQARLEAASNIPEQGSYYYPGWGYGYGYGGYYGAPHHHGVGPYRGHIGQRAATGNLTLGPSSPTIGVMRPGGK